MSPSSIPSDEAVFVQPRPYKVELEPGKDYWWCSCGRSKNQPFCDGSHKGTAFTPKKVTVSEKKAYYLCGCKLTHNAVGFCDGTHNKEEGVKKYNSFLLKSNSTLRTEIDDLKKKQKNMTICVYSVLAVGIAAAAGLWVKLKK